MSVKNKDKIPNTTGCCEFKWRSRKTPDFCPNPDCPTRAADGDLFRLWCGLFEEDPQDPEARKKFDAIRPEIPNLRLSSEDYDRLMAEMEKEQE